VVSSFQAFQPKLCVPFLSPHARYVPRPSHPPWFDHPNNIWWRVQTMQLLIMQFYTVSCHFIPLRSKCSQRKCLSFILKFISKEIIKRKIYFYEDGFFWDVAPCSLVEIDRRFGGQDLWNVSQFLRAYTAHHPSRHLSSYSQPWEPEILWLYDIEYTYPAVSKVELALEVTLSKWKCCQQASSSRTWCLFTTDTNLLLLSQSQYRCHAAQSEISFLIFS
jgi:hypothetical protein